MKSYNFLGSIFAVTLMSTVGCDKRVKAVVDPAGPAELEEMYTQLYYIPPSWAREGEGPVLREGEGPALKRKKTAKEILIENGVTFPEGSQVFTSYFSGIGFRNTDANHERLREYLDREHPGEWRIHEPPSAMNEGGEQGADDQLPAPAESDSEGTFKP